MSAKFTGSLTNVDAILGNVTARLASDTTDGAGYDADRLDFTLADVTTVVVWSAATSIIGTLAHLAIKANKDLLVEVKGDAADKISGQVVKAGFLFLLSGDTMPEGIAGGAETVTQVQIRNESGADATVEVLILGT